MPRYPSLPGNCISSAASFTTIFSGVTISSWKVSAIEFAANHQCSGAALLRCRFHFFCSFNDFVNRALHIEGLFRNVVVFPFDDVLESFHRISNLYVPARRPRELLSDVEGLRE